jgi:hypothetical protein
VVAPPSVHESGNRYDWIIPWGVTETLPLPPKIINAMNEKDGKGVTDWHHKLNENINEGERNQTASSVCGKLMLRFLEHEWNSQVWPLLVAWNMEHAKPPLSERELKSIFVSIGNSERRRKKTGATIGNPTVAEKNGVYDVSIPISDGIAVFVFEDLEATGKDMEALVHTAIEMTGQIQKIFSQKLIINSSSSRDGYVKALKDSFGKDIPWALILSQACSALTIYVQDHTEEQVMADIRPEDTKYLLYPYVEENAPNIIFGRGGVGKTYLALRMALSIAGGVPFLSEDCDKKLNMLFVDYESTPSNFAHRINTLIAGLPFNVPDDIKERFVYFNPRGLSLHDLVRKIKKVMVKRNIGFIVIDSAALACGGQPEEAQTAIRYFNAMAKLGTTTLTIAHETKAENNQYAFGSIFFTNSARNIWNVQLERDAGDNTINVGLFHRKSNNGKLVNGRGAEITFEDNKVEIISGSTERFPREENIGQKILRCLRDRGWSTARDIATYLDIKMLSSVQQSLSRMKSKELVVNAGDKWNCAAN